MLSVLWTLIKHFFRVPLKCRADAGTPALKCRHLDKTLFYLNVKVGGMNFFPPLVPQWRTFFHTPQFGVHLYNKYASLWRTNSSLWRTNVPQMCHLRHIFVIFSLSFFNLYLTPCPLDTRYYYFT